jgi:hypothetical protein
MKNQVKKWTARLVATVVVIVSLLLMIVLNPVLTYANKKDCGNFTIYYSSTLHPAFIEYLDEATALIKKSELYDGNIKLDICLNDGSNYPSLIKAIQGPAFAYGFYNKVVLQGTMNCNGNNVELNGYKWNLTQLLAHEMVHCLQYSKLGFWKSNPIANVPHWKWEGYAEYVSRRDLNQQNLVLNIDRLNKADKNSWCVEFEDGTIAPNEYYNAWTLIQYCIDIKQLTFQQLLSDTTNEQTIKQEMMNWYESERGRYSEVGVN